MTLIVDSFAWVEFLSAGRGGQSVRQSIESAEELVTPDIVLAEIARVFARQGMSEDRIAGHLRSVSALSSVRAVDSEVAILVIQSDTDLKQKARRERRRPSSFADSIVLAFARRFSGQVLTADPHFKDLAETVWVGE